jgi:hypothetical protein
MFFHEIKMPRLADSGCLVTALTQHSWQQKKMFFHEEDWTKRRQNESFYKVVKFLP